MTNPWRFLENLPGLNATRSGWQAGLGSAYEWFSPFLKALAEPALSVPCPWGCGCAHRVVRLDDGVIAGVCDCSPQRCGELTLTAEDLVVWELDQVILGRALCRALGLRSKARDTGLPNVLQAGCWSADEVPVYLILECDRAAFEAAVARLVARQRNEPFILLAPTSVHLDAGCRADLALARGAFFALDAIIRLAEDATLKANRPPGEIFAEFSPKAPVEEEVARQVFAFVRAMDDAAGPGLKAPVSTVFRLYCLEGLSAAAVAERCHCSKGTVITRLAALRRKAKRDPAELRSYSCHYEEIEDSLREDRGKRRYRKGEGE